MPEDRKPPISRVGDLLGESAASLRLRLLAGGAGLGSDIISPRIQKPGLALTGFVRHISPGRVQVLGRTEVGYLAELAPDRRRQVIADLVGAPIACLVLTRALDPPAELFDLAEERGVPLLQTPLHSGDAIEQIGRFLENLLAPGVVEHGVLVDVYGLGVLISGESGVGKSECALDLIVRGHRLVADDLVEIRRIGGALVCSGAELTRYHMELRGLGIINIKDLFGVTSVRHHKWLELIVRLDPWKKGKAYDRLGMDEIYEEILGIKVPLIEMPVAPGRNLSMLVEVAARNQLLKSGGHHPAQELARRLGERLRPPQRAPAARMEEGAGGHADGSGPPAALGAPEAGEGGKDR